MVKVRFTTQGCSSNVRESEIMVGLLSNSGCSITDEKKEADVNVVNICTVKGNRKALREIKRVKSEFPDSKIVVAGCITESIISQIKNIDENASLVNTHNLGKISSVVENSINGIPLEFTGKNYEEKVNLPSIRKNPVVGIVPILNGCNYYCTFCSTKIVKGKLFSYSMDSIRNDVKSHLKSGCREIWITSNYTGAYMVEQGGRQKLPELLEQVLSIPIDFKLRVGMMNPGNTLAIIDKLIKIYKHQKMFKFLHIPVQSGNNDILNLMNRKYTAEQFMEVVEAFRKEMPEITISTDMIIGFPSETESQFNDSLNLIKNARPDVLNISRYSAREGTSAAKMKQIIPSILKERSNIMTNNFKKLALENNRKRIGWEGRALVDDVGRKNSFVARNYCYKPIILRGKFNLGDSVDVKISDATCFDLRAEI